jgi:hypothetical protein
MLIGGGDDIERPPDFKVRPEPSSSLGAAALGDDTPSALRPNAATTAAVEPSHAHEEGARGTNAERRCPRRAGAVFDRMPRWAIALVVVFVISIAATAAAHPWRTVPGARRLVRADAPRVTVELRASGGMGCGGGGCNGGVEVRNVRGELPSDAPSYFYSDRPGREPGCFATARESLFEGWTEAVIAPARGQGDERPACGIGFFEGSTAEYWVILRVRRSNAP